MLSPGWGTLTNKRGPTVNHNYTIRFHLNIKGMDQRKYFLQSFSSYFPTFFVWNRYCSVYKPVKYLALAVNKPFKHCACNHYSSWKILWKPHKHFYINIIFQAFCLSWNITTDLSYINLTNCTKFEPNVDNLLKNFKSNSEEKDLNVAQTF